VEECNNPYLAKGKCSKHYAADRYAANPDRHRKVQKRWDATHPEVIEIARIKWIEAHPEQAKASQDASSARYRVAHPDRVKASKAAWNERHPEKGREYAHRRRARLQQVDVEEFEETEIFERDDYICQLCFAPIDPFLKDQHPMMASLDHIVALSNGGHHTHDNVQATHLVCNMRKGNR
jgi:5-methylcytosine-specific restriction endonuclease McrA